MKIGLVLEGGAMRGVYTAGVLDVFMQNGIKVDGIVGVSAGALFGVNYLSKQIGRVIRYNKRFNRDKNYMGLRPLLREGNIVSTKYAYGHVPRELDIFDDEAFQASDIPFYAVATDIESGQAEYIHIKSVFDQIDSLRASGSMPFVSRPVEIDGRLFLDGAISDAVPYKWMSEQGYDKLIVVLTRESDYRKRAIPKILSRLKYGKYPKFKEQLFKINSIYNDSIKELSDWVECGKAFMIRPSRKLKMAYMEKAPSKLQATYELGMLDAEGLLEPLREYLSK